MIFQRMLKLQIRKWKRHPVSDAAYVIYGHSVARHQLNDIGMGGLSFYYEDQGRTIDRGYRELTLVHHNRVFMKNLAFRTVSDIETGEVLFRNKRVKRRSVRFVGLSGQQKQQLKRFIADVRQ